MLTVGTLSRRTNMTFSPLDSSARSMVGNTAWGASPGVGTPRLRSTPVAWAA